MTCNDLQAKLANNPKDCFKESVVTIIDKFKRSRQTRFANSNKCDVNSIHVHNDKPIPYLVKQFKDSNSIKSRVYKSLTPDQQSAWLSYYDSNKQLRIMTDEQHRQFHDTHKFDVKTGMFVELASTQLESCIHQTSIASSVKRKQSNETSPNESGNDISKSLSKKSCKLIDKSPVDKIDKPIKTKRSTTKSVNHDSDSNNSDNNDEPPTKLTPPVTTTNVIKTKVARAKKSHK